MQPEKTEPENAQPKDKVDARQGEIRGIHWILIISFGLSVIALVIILMFFVS